MKRAIRNLWCKELRDPKRKQARCQLFDGEGMCCLGVLADVMVDGDWVEENEGFWTLGGRSALLFDEDLEAWGLTTHDQDGLRLLNDSKRFTFPQIADWIEANVPVED